MSTSYVYLWHSSRRQMTSRLFLQEHSPRHIRHSQLNYIIWRAVKKAQIPATKEPICLSRTDGKRPDGATLIQWVGGKPLAWDVTVTDTYAASHICRNGGMRRCSRHQSDGEQDKQIFLPQQHTPLCADSNRNRRIH